MLVVVSRGRGAAREAARRRASGAGLWSLPEAPVEADPARACAATTACASTAVEALEPFAHAFTHFTLAVTPWLVRVEGRRWRRRGSRSRCGSRLQDAQDAALPAPVKQLLARLPGAAPSRARLLLAQEAVQDREPGGGVGELQQLLLHRLAQRQDLGEAEAHPARVVVAVGLREPGRAQRLHHLAHERGALRRARAAARAPPRPSALDVAEDEARGASSASRSRRKRSSPSALTLRMPSVSMSHSAMRARQPTVSGTAGVPTSSPSRMRQTPKAESCLRQALAMSM